MSRFSDMKACFSLLLQLAVLVLATSATAVPNVRIIAQDYEDNLQATDREWFYRNPSDGSALPTGNGYYNSLEYTEEVVGRTFQIGRIAYVRNTPIKVKLKLYNPQPTMTGTLTFLAARIAVPPLQPDRPTTTYINLTLPPDTVLTISQNGTLKQL